MFDVGAADAVDCVGFKIVAKQAQELAKERDEDCGGGFIRGGQELNGCACKVVYGVGVLGVLAQQGGQGLGDIASEAVAIDVSGHPNALGYYVGARYAGANVGQLHHVELLQGWAELRCRAKCAGCIRRQKAIAGEGGQAQVELFVAIGAQDQGFDNIRAFH